MGYEKVPLPPRTIGWKGFRFDGVSSVVIPPLAPRRRVTPAPEPHSSRPARVAPLSHHLRSGANTNGSRTASQIYHFPGVLEPVALASVAARRHMLRGTRREPGGCDIRNGYPAVQERRAAESQNDQAQTISLARFPHFDTVPGCMVRQPWSRA
jgi:hypothetical protein